MEKNIVIRNDLMSSNLPSIWLEYKEPNKEALLIGGFYREWNHKGDTTEAGQVKRMEEFSTQLERISEEKKKCIVLGDANLCSLKWKEENFGHKLIAKQILEALEQFGLSEGKIGFTYQSDNIKKMVTLLSQQLIIYTIALNSKKA